jgi:hypothetical protein
MKSDPKTYRAAVKWVAENDEPHQMDVEEISSSISVLMISDLFKVDSEKVAKAIVRIRRKFLEDLMG